MGIYLFQCQFCGVFQSYEHGKVATPPLTPWCGECSLPEGLSHAPEASLVVLDDVGVTVSRQ